MATKTEGATLDPVMANRIERFDRDLRFRPYVVRDGTLTWLAGAGTSTETGIVPMLLQLHAEEEFSRRDQVGILDTEKWERGLPATWIISPWGPSKTTITRPGR